MCQRSHFTTITPRWKTYKAQPDQQWIGHDLEAEDSMLEAARDLEATNIMIFIDSEHLWNGESLEKVEVFDALRIHVGPWLEEEGTVDLGYVTLIMFASPCNTPELPTRVIDVGAEDADKNLKLVVTRGQSGCYAALSHCWGGKVSALLTTNNIDDFEDSIRFQDLPLTFQDVIRITRGLNIRYLWIDSLCIIQNSNTDWEQESKNMGLYYGNSTVTLYASLAKSSTSGIFQRDTPRPLVGPKPVYLDLFSGTEIDRQIKVQALDFDDETLAELDLHGPLASRGWTLQESVLAPHQLYFGNRQIYWKCLQEVQSADGLPVGCRTPFFTYPSLMPALFSSTLVNRMKSATATDEFLLDYYRLVETYSSRKLSFASDKLLAFSGLVQRIHSSIGGDYLAGLWSYDLHRGLAWYPEMTTCRHVSSYRAPSWSWAITDESILISDEQFKSDEFKMRLIGYNVTLCDPTNPYGQIESGYILVGGFVKSLYRSAQSMSFRGRIDSLGDAYYDEVVQDDGHSPSNITKIVRANIDNEDCLMTIDYENGKAENLEIDFDAFLPGEYTVLLLGTYKHEDREDMIRASGLILQELKDIEGEITFERAGLLLKIELDPDWLLEWEERTLKLF
ncbi:hypothetical protein NPX13_g7676 [Xylaria arbuscula]|uniref:Heterokaryon incompatibility domain-containing protein n=1 Tax=Xylaria arbuscula TaxID=114810 RepID=A0A9W8N9J8_9PEZI|nr:hypothetical protein NPX13_g7676 [Xylaria arbuscula]